jgi:protein-S-isoprenylcysteine O-methyltransferase Ste14
MLSLPSWVEWTAFGISLTGALSIFALSALTMFKRGFQFFPPPSKQSWQHATFLTLFRLFLYPLVALTLITFRPASGPDELLVCAIGGLLVTIGFGLAFRITLQMGWRNAFGEKRGLLKSGWFARSRNPVYVATWIALVGWGLIASDSRVVTLLILWAVMYWVAPRLEEPWLEQQYGDEYRQYKVRTPRFLGPSRRQG